jgi:DNA-binding SARP family transcriptional activator
VVGALVAAVLAFTAVPAVLVLVVGDPLSGGLGHSWQPAPRDALVALAVAAWIAWAASTSQLVRGVVVHVRRGEVRSVGIVTPLDRIAARIAVGVLALTTVGTPLVLASDAGAATTTPSLVAVAPQPAPSEAVSPALAAVHTVHIVHTVQPGEGLWRIADAHLGDGADWMQIAALNLGRDMGGGQRFVDPDHVVAGWRLRLPDEAADTGHRAEHVYQHPARSRPSGAPDRLPELIGLGCGSLACAALARRARRRHRPAQFTGELDLPLRGGPSRPGRLSEAAVDTDALLQRFPSVPALDAFEAANCLLARSLELDEAGDYAGGAGAPRVRIVCVSSAGVTFSVTGAAHDAPDGFITVGDSMPGGTAWHVGHDVLEGLGTQTPFPCAPIVFPVGDDDHGTWFVGLGPGDVLPVLGESAPSLLRAARAAAESWAWSDLVIVTDDPDDPGLQRRSVPALFFGDPGALRADVARHVAVVTTAPAAATDLTVLVDRQAATLHPVGRVLRPHLQSADTARLVAELVNPTDPLGVPSLEREPVPEPVEPPQVSAPAPVPRSAVPTALTPGPVDVRLLTVTPRLDGLAEELPPNRARRAVELVAYLALHQPDVTTSDRLRTRVLGSSDADAAAKTLFNTAYAARRAMGTSPDGAPLFPGATRNGLYQLSPEVTVDVQRAATLVSDAKAHDDARLAMAHYRAALDLVEGEPLANALSGYSWWEAEGHGARIAAVLVDAACCLAALAADAGLFDLARWGLERAQLVEPYSEALSRAAMELAAAEGDADRLRLEWRECQRRVDALDPGSSPSLRTESLYGELSRRVLVGASNDVATTDA